MDDDSSYYSSWSIHYRNRKLCRVPRTLPSFLYRALGKGCLCRVPKLEHSTTTRPSARLVIVECSGSALDKDVLFAECSDIPSAIFAECKRLTLGKFWPTVKLACCRQLFAECTKATLGKEALYRVSKADTRQSIIFFGSCTSKFFTSPHTTCGTPCLSLVYF